MGRPAAGVFHSAARPGVEDIEEVNRRSITVLATIVVALIVGLNLFLVSQTIGP